jgi:hypothetical protein
MNLPSASERLGIVLRGQHKAIATESSYVYWLRQYVTALITMPPPCPASKSFVIIRCSAGEHKNGKDRVVALPQSLVPEIVQQIKCAQAVWLRDSTRFVDNHARFDAAPERSLKKN